MFKKLLQLKAEEPQVYKYPERKASKARCVVTGVDEHQGYRSQGFLQEGPCLLRLKVRSSAVLPSLGLGFRVEA